jgi:aminoglycoside phosphotransferase
MNAEARARSVLTAAGLPRDATLERASSDANEVWLGPDFVLRINARGDPGRLAREAAVASRLPAEVGYPPILAVGTHRELEWILSVRVPGQPLPRVWHTLTEAQRRDAIRQVSRAVRLLHAVDPTGLPTDRDLDPPHVLPLDRIEEQLECLKGQLDEGLRKDLSDRVNELWPAFDDRNRGLVHGDLHFGNVLWHEAHDEGRVTALLDFEWARVSWVEVDQEIVRAFCADPAWFVPEADEPLMRTEDWAQVPTWFEAGRDPHPRQADRLLVLAISRQLGHLIDHPAVRPERLDDPRDRRGLLHRLLAAAG